MTPILPAVRFAVAAALVAVLPAAASSPRLFPEESKTPALDELRRVAVLPAGAAGRSMDGNTRPVWTVPVRGAEGLKTGPLTSPSSRTVTADKSAPAAAPEADDLLPSGWPLAHLGLTAAWIGGLALLGSATSLFAGYGLAAAAGWLFYQGLRAANPGERNFRLSLAGGVAGLGIAGAVGPQAAVVGAAALLGFGLFALGKAIFG